MHKVTSIGEDFRKFILRGSVIDLAVGVVMGGAFGSVVTALVADIITPIPTIPGKVNFSALALKVGGATFKYGDFLNTVISFFLLSASVFFLIVRPVNWLMDLRKSEPPPETPTRECPFCLSKIPAAASRCSFCTSEVTPEVPAAAAPAAG